MAKYHRILGKVSKLSVFSVLFVSLIYVIWYTLVPLLFRWPRTFSLNCIVNQSFNKNIQEILEKSPCIVCRYGKRPYFCTRFRERKRRSSRGFEKNFRKNLEVRRKSPYLCIRFPKKEEAFEQSSMNRLHKQQK